MVPLVIKLSTRPGLDRGPKQAMNWLQGVSAGAAGPCNSSRGWGRLATLWTVVKAAPPALGVQYVHVAACYAHVAVCRISRLPAQLLAACSSLCTLCAHQNPITVEDIRKADGHAEYEARWVLCSSDGAGVALGA